MELADSDKVDGPGNIAQTLDRLLKAVERERGHSRLDLVLVVVLGLAALGSTWCAYQSQLWNGTQLVRLAEADVATQEAHEQALAGLQTRTTHGLVLLHYLDALQRKDVQLAEAMHRRMPSPLREALDAWLRLDPLNNPDAPPPGKMQQYVLAEDQLAADAREKALRQRTAAQEAGANGDAYVLATLLFASVLFFGGIAGSFSTRLARLGFTGMACILLLTTAAWVASMPVSS